MVETAEGVMIREAGTGKFAQRIDIGGHVLTADEPVERGGTDTGPTPTQLLAASLGACTSMTLRFYAAHKNWALGRVSVEVKHARVKDAAGKTVERFERIITVDDDLTEEQRAKLVEIAEKCPVHKLLMTPDKMIETRVV